MYRSGELSGEIDTSRPHSARLYDYYLGGKDWYPVDQETAEQVKKAFPAAGTFARANRDFMQRATRTLAAEHGIRQFVDIGTGIPTEPNLHQIAQHEAPECRVVYADHDPTVLEYAEVLMRSAPEGRTAYIQADVRHDSVLDARQLRDVVDMDRPVALSLVALLHFVTDKEEPYELVQSMVEKLAPGSFLVLSHVTPEFAPEMIERAIEIYDRGGTPAQARTRAEVASFFEGLELLDPGLALAHRWRADELSELSEPSGSAELTDADVSCYAGVARKPE